MPLLNSEYKRTRSPIHPQQDAYIEYIEYRAYMHIQYQTLKTSVGHAWLPWTPFIHTICHLLGLNLKYKLALIFLLLEKVVRLY